MGSGRIASPALNFCAALAVPAMGRRKTPGHRLAAVPTAQVLD